MNKPKAPATLSSSPSEEIPNIDIGHVYDQRYLELDMHCEHLEKLADFFGRNMPVHYHDRFYQIHVVLNGIVHVHLDETTYSANGPMFFLTPPNMPHAFIIDNQAKGYVITARQQLVWELSGRLEQRGWSNETLFKRPLCVELKPDSNSSAKRMLDLLELMSEEIEQDRWQHGDALKALLQLVLIDISRLAEYGQGEQNTRKEDVRIFHRFNELIEFHYKEHLALGNYASKIGVTEARLNEICRRLAGLPSKRLIMDRLMQEARRQLTFSSAPITEISYQLGFKDPAYFARFFRRNAGLTASDFRTSKNQFRD